MARYIAKDADGNKVNIIEIEPEQIEEWQALTGLTLELPPPAESSPETDETVDFAQAYVDLLAETIANENGLEV